MLAVKARFAIHCLRLHCVFLPGRRTIETEVSMMKNEKNQSRQTAYNCKNQTVQKNDGSMNSLYQGQSMQTGRDSYHQGLANSASRHYVSRASMKSDPLGSYTGKPQNRYDQPTQDADDL